MSSPPIQHEAAALAWSGDGHWLAVHNERGVIQLQRVNTPEHLVVPVDVLVTALALSHDAEWLAAGGGGQVLLWRLTARRRQAREVSRGRWPEAATTPDTDAPIELAFAPDSRSLAVGCGTRVLLLRLDADAFKQPIDVSTLRIRAVAERWDFVLATPAGQLTSRQRVPSNVDRDHALDSLRRVLVPTVEQSAEELNAALQPWRERFLPAGLGESQAMASTGNALSLDVDGTLSHHPWELLVTGRVTPLGCTQGLVRYPPQQTTALKPVAADVPLHTLLIAASAPGGLQSVADLNRSLGQRLAQTLRESGPAQGLLHTIEEPDAHLAVVQLLEEPWRLLVLVGDANPEGQLALDGETAIGAREVQAMRRPPDIVLLLGDDFRQQAPRMREIGVNVVVASGWPMDGESLWAFFSEWLNLLRAGEPLIRATQMARQYAYTRSTGTAWALEVHGDPLWTWPDLPAWVGPAPAAPSASRAPEAPEAPAAPAEPADQQAAWSEELLQAVPGRDAMVLEFGDAPPIILSPVTVKEAAEPGAGGKSAGGLLGAGILKALSVFTGNRGDAAKELQVAAAALDARMGSVLFPLGVDGRRAPGNATPNTSGRTLVPLHGLLADTDITFAVTGTEAEPGLRRLFEHFAGNAFGFDYPTLTRSPIDVATSLVRALPAGTRLVLLTHGSGALVAETIVRATLDDPVPLAEPGLRSSAGELRAAISAKRLQVARVVRVAGSVFGVSKSVRWDSRLALQVQLLDRIDSSEAMQKQRRALLLAVARGRDTAPTLPGLAALEGDGAFLRWLHGSTGTAAGTLRVVAGILRGDSLAAGLRLLLADGLFDGDTDLVVPARLSYGGVRRAGGASYFLDAGPEISHYSYFQRPLSGTAIADALMIDEPLGFKTIGPLAWAGESSDGSR